MRWHTTGCFILYSKNLAWNSVTINLIRWSGRSWVIKHTVRYLSTCAGCSKIKKRVSISIGTICHPIRINHRICHISLKLLLKKRRSRAKRWCCLVIVVSLQQPWISQRSTIPAKNVICRVNLKHIIVWTTTIICQNLKRSRGRCVIA